MSTLQQYMEIPAPKRHLLSRKMIAYTVPSGHPGLSEITWRFSLPVYVADLQPAACTVIRLINDGSLVNDTIRQFATNNATVEWSLANEYLYVTVTMPTRQLKPVVNLMARLFSDGIYTDETIAAFSHKGHRMLEPTILEEVTPEQLCWTQFSLDYASIQATIEPCTNPAQLTSFYQQHIVSGYCDVFMITDDEHLATVALDNAFGGLPLRSMAVSASKQADCLGHSPEEVIFHRAVKLADKNKLEAELKLLISRYYHYTAGYYIASPYIVRGEQTESINEEDDHPHQLSTIRKTHLTILNVENVKKFLSMQLMQLFETPLTKARLSRQLFHNGKSADYVLRLATAIEQLTPGWIHKMANKIEDEG